MSCFPSSWGLLLPQSWDTRGGARRERCRIPDDKHHRPKWRLAQEMLEKLAGTALRPAVLVADIRIRRQCRLPPRSARPRPGLRPAGQGRDDRPR
ncbi:transposase [Streptomyces xantholiticus]